MLARKLDSPWGKNLREYLLLMFDYDIVWTPKHKHEEPPF